MAPNVTSALVPPKFLSGVGEIGEIISSRDWAATSLGPVEGWSATVRNMVAMIVRSPIAMVTMWGAEGLLIYNDAYATFAGLRHPDILGMTAEAAFPELAQFNRNVIETVMGGAPLTFRDQELTWTRNGAPQRYWLNLDYSPILDETDETVGVIAIVIDTTDKVTAERKLHGEQGRLGQMFDQAPGFMALLAGPSHVITLANQAYMELVGHRAVIGRTVAEALPEAAEQGFVSLLDSLYETGEVYTGTAVPFSVLDTDISSAQHRFVDFVYQPLRNDDGVIFGIFVQGSDVTDRVLAEQSTRDGESRFKVWAQAMPNQVWSADAAGQLTWFNDQVYSYSGAAPGTLDGEAWASIVHIDDVADAAVTWAKAVATGTTYEKEFRIRRHDGEYRWYLIRALPIFNDQDAVSSWIGTNTDIEDQKLNTKQLAHLNATLEQQIEMRTAERDRMWRLSNEIMLVSDFNSNLLSINPAFTLALGWSSDEVIGTSFMNLVHPEDRERTLSQVTQLSAGATTFRFENRYLKKDGSFCTLSWSAVPEGGHIYGIARDVTAERATAEAMKQTEKALQQAQKMDAIGKLTGGVAHEFNDLLQVISGNLQLLSRVPLSHDRASQWIESAIGGVTRGAKLASSLLAFGRRQALEPKVVKIGSVVAGMEHMLRHALGEPIDIEIIISGGLWNTFVDITQVETALLNLAINARDAMDGPGKLTIEVGNGHLDELYCRHHVDVTPGQYVTLSVTDTGSGMPPEVMAHAFDPFFSTKPEGKGTGLGLSMIYGFVKQSGGHVKIYSEVGQGTTVKIYLPRSTAEEAVQEPVVLTELVGGSETILIAEDDDGVRAIAVEMLNELGYRVLKANDAQSALAILESGIPVDLLFTDVVMPGALRSPELARKAKELIPHLAVLFTSGYTENAIVHGGRLDAGVELLGKPYTRDTLARKIRLVLSTGRKVSARAPAKSTVEVNSAPIPSSSAATGEQACRILLVEDEDEVRNITVEMLQALGFNVVATTDGSSALKALETSRFDILITDMGLPGLSGAQVASEARRISPQMRIIVASGKALEDGVPADEALLKPYNLRSLETAVRKVATKPLS